MALKNGRVHSAQWSSGSRERARLCAATSWEGRRAAKNTQGAGVTAISFPTYLGRSRETTESAKPRCQIHIYITTAESYHFVNTRPHPFFCIFSWKYFQWANLWRRPQESQRPTLHSLSIPLIPVSRLLLCPLAVLPEIATSSSTQQSTD